uniref:Vanadium-dependent haloperoxidase n=1 Tax=Roseihalotalea indica TaxID=2867963 RepID=A0AA49JJN7_9BACT|nr:vanadium-dependent haloperoxidase [Tunicatimonas sp. TK19036]
MKNLKKRKKKALKTRIKAAKIANKRVHPDEHVDNGDERHYVNHQGEKTYLMNFTKGLKHDAKIGLVSDPTHYQLFVKGIDSGDPKEFENTPLGPGFIIDEAEKDPYCKVQPDWKSEKGKTGGKDGMPVKIRAWESSGAGLTFDVQGPDAQAVTMKPVPKLGSDELTAEIGEVYAQALLRDIPLATLYSKSEDTQTEDGYRARAKQLIKHLNKLPFFKQPDPKEYHHNTIHRGKFTLDTAFRGFAPGDLTGPYLSQFLLLGNTGVNKTDPEHIPADGYIAFGALRIDQRVRTAKPEVDFMQRWDEWLDVQNGADFRGLEQYIQDEKAEGLKKRRFITTGRDLATYVHYDALYEAYLNACLILLSAGAPFDQGIPFQSPDLYDRQQGFAHFGGPHILTLVPEVATRALKAVRFQKFNIHRRLRPEALAARLQMHDKIIGHCIDSRYDTASHVSLIDQMQNDLKSILSEVDILNPDFGEGYTMANPDIKCDIDHNYLLPMAFCEGSPMHPSYGAGHATVAGACVTILKAFFDTDQYLNIASNKKSFKITSNESESKYAFIPRADGEKLETVKTDALSVGGELNKLAANISIGRNWAGVHYYSDYVESMRMGEEIAIGMLQEQSIMYNPLENSYMTLEKFDGSKVLIKHGKVKTI